MDEQTARNIEALKDEMQRHVVAHEAAIRGLINATNFVFNEVLRSVPPHERRAVRERVAHMQGYFDAEPQHLLANEAPTNDRFRQMAKMFFDTTLMDWDGDDPKPPKFDIIQGGKADESHDLP